MTDEQFQQKTRESILKRYKNATDDELNEFIPKCAYQTGDYKDSESYSLLSDRLEEMDNRHDTGGNHVFYMAIPPNVYCPVANHLSSAGLTNEQLRDHPYVHVVIEKPYGRDLQSAMNLDRELHNSLSEHQIYRIDHYLGKETVQNILMFRFANAIFEPIWNRRYIDQIQITVAESLGVEHRAGYFEQAGLLRDMFQNHILQMLALVAMEPPTSFDADRVRDERVKLMRSIRPFPLDDLDRSIVRGQYVAGSIDGEEVTGYRQEPGVDSDSQVETYIAARAFIDNWRWQGVPFYMRSGKRLARKISEIAIVFKRVPHSMFSLLSPDQMIPNVLVMNVQPEEGITLKIQAKQPGAKLCMNSLTMDFHYKDMYDFELPDAYERLLLDCMLGDQTLFWRSDGIEASWALVTPVLEKLEADDSQPDLYESGSWGPREAEKLLAVDGRKWRKL